MGFIKKIKSSRSVSSRSVSSRSVSKKKSKKQLSKSMPAALPSAAEEQSEQQVVDDIKRLTISCKSISLGSGSFSATGVMQLKSFSYSPHSNSTESIASLSDDSLEQQTQHNLAVPDLPTIRERKPSKVFIRTADLPHMEEATSQSRHSSFADLSDDQLVDYVHKRSAAVPIAKIEHDPQECWVALDDGNGAKAPLVEAAVASLVKTALDASMNQGMWTANGSTAKLLKSGNWNETTFMPCQEMAVPAPYAKGAKGENDVLVWSGTWSHKYYGHDIPAIRCEAIVNMSPKAMADLLVDSTRVKEYNKMSIGRDDIMVLHQGETCVTKITLAKTKPPMLGKTLVLRNLLHMEELPGGGKEAGYVIVTRAVAHADDAEAAEDPKVIHSEMLLGLNVIRAVEGEPDRCILINLNHLSSPMIPMMFAKRLGLSAAVNFINDIRALC